MPRPRRMNRKSKPKRVYRRNRKSMVKRGNVPDKASCSVKTSILPTGGGNYASNIMYNQNSVQLSQFNRALTIAKAYQFYRISKIKLTYLFPFDTFQNGVANGGSRPNFYYMIDKAGAFPLATTLDMLKQAGARPKAIDEKPKSISWRPSVLTEEETLGGAVPAQYKLSPWLAVEADTIQHRGLYWYVEQLFGGGTQYEVEMEVQFEFKKPLWATASTPPALSIGSKPATQEEVQAQLVH